MTHPSESAESPARAVLEGIESAAGMFFCMTVSLVVPTACLLSAIQPQGMWIRNSALALAALAVSGLAEGYCIFLAYGSFGSRRPVGVSFAPAVALRQKRLPVPLRPVAAVWWLAHFALGVALAFGTHSGGHDGSGWRGDEIASAAALSFGLTYAANLYLLLGVSALTRSERAVWMAWRFRVLVDLGVVAAATMTAGAATLRVWW